MKLFFPVGFSMKFIVHQFANYRIVLYFILGQVHYHSDHNQNQFLKNQSIFKEKRRFFSSYHYNNDLVEWFNLMIYWFEKS